MIKYRLNKDRIEEEMAARQLNLTDLSRLLGWSRQLTFHAINFGSKSFAPKIAKAIGVNPEDIIISAVKGDNRHKPQIPELTDMSSGQ